MITRLQGVCVALLVLGDTVFAAVRVSKMPGKVPVHWNMHGGVDRMGSPWELALILPASLLFTVLVLLSILFIGSVRESLARSGNMYGRVMLAALGTMVVVHVILMTYFDQPQALIKGLQLPVGVLFMVLGNWMGKIRRNPVMGIRTPWTLKSDYVWERTHRVGGRLMVAHGILVVLAALFLPLFATIAVLLLGIIGLCVGLTIYSARLARRERQDNDVSPTAASAR